jgi:hypothetical protein
MLTWKGDEVRNKTFRAAGRAVDGLLSDCVTMAKGKAPRRTSAYQGSIQMRPAVLGSGDIIFGQWGSFAINYAMMIERGTRAHVIMPVNKRALYWPGAAHPVAMVFHPGTHANPVLTSTMEQLAPNLPMRIRMEMGG